MPETASYSQKYALVSFINPAAPGAEFSMEDWPLHITLADVFAINLRGTHIEEKLATFFSNQDRMQVSAGEEATLGTAEVVLIEPTNELAKLHTSIIDLLK